MFPRELSSSPCRCTFANSHSLQQAVTQCTADSGNVEDCPVFDFFTDEFSEGCKIPAEVDEVVSGVLAALPGCNPIQPGPEVAVQQSGCGATTTIGPALLPYVDLTVSKGFEYIGCGTDVAFQTRTLSGASTAGPNMTVEYCVDYCVGEGFSIAGVEYTDECYCGDSVPSDRAPTAGLMGDCTMPCAGDSSENCGGAQLISLYQKCDGTCENVQYGVNTETPLDAKSAPLIPPASYTSPTTSSASAVASVAEDSDPIKQFSHSAAASTSTLQVYSTVTVLPIAVSSSSNSLPAPASSLVLPTTASDCAATATVTIPATTIYMSASDVQAVTSVISISTRTEYQTVTVPTGFGPYGFSNATASNVASTGFLTSASGSGVHSTRVRPTEMAGHGKEKRDEHIGRHVHAGRRFW